MSDTEIQTVYCTLDLNGLTFTIGIIVSPRFPATRSEPGEGGLHGIEAVYFGENPTSNLTELLSDDVLDSLATMAYEQYINE